MRSNQSVQGWQRGPVRVSSLRLALAGAAAAVALAGCQVGVVEDPTTGPAAPVESEPAQTEPVATEPVETEPVETGTEPVETDVRTAAPGDDDTADDATTQEDDPAGDAAADGGGSGPAAGGGEVAQPGEEFEVGDTVTTHRQALEPGDTYYGYATLATTVTSVEKGDPDLFADAENAADLAGYTPWFVEVEHEWLTYEGEPNDNMIPPLVAFNEAGGEVSPVINATWSAGVPGCTIDMPEEKGVGQKATNCHVFAVPDSEAIGAVGWRGDDYADGGGIASDNPYYDDPVLWLVP